MGERETVIDKQRVTYEGLFDAKELYKLIERFFSDRNYEKREINNIEVVKPEGKFIDIEWEPWKKYTDYYRNLIHLRLIISDMKEVEIEKDGVKKKLNQGKLQLIFDAIIETDYQHRWESKGIYFFLRTIFNKYVYKPYTKQYRGSCGADVNSMIAQIKAFLNLYRN